MQQRGGGLATSVPRNGSMTWVDVLAGVRAGVEGVAFAGDALFSCLNAKPLCECKQAYFDYEGIMTTCNQTVPATLSSDFASVCNTGQCASHAAVVACGDVGVADAGTRRGSCAHRSTRQVPRRDNRNRDVHHLQPRM